MLVITWSAPCANGRPIAEYRVEVSDQLVGEDNYKPAVSDGATTAEIKGLQPAFTYRLRVAVL